LTLSLCNLSQNHSFHQLLCVWTTIKKHRIPSIFIDPGHPLDPSPSRNTSIIMTGRKFTIFITMSSLSLAMHGGVVVQ
jgi:hypothetical protein